MTWTEFICMLKKTIPNNVPKKYKDKLIRFIKITGGVFGKMYYKPLKARIVDPDNFTTMYIVNLENGKIYVPRKINRMKLIGTLVIDDDESVRKAFRQP